MRVTTLVSHIHTPACFQWLYAEWACDISQTWANIIMRDVSLYSWSVRSFPFLALFSYRPWMGQPHIWCTCRFKGTCPSTMMLTAGIVWYPRSVILLCPFGATALIQELLTTSQLCGQTRLGKASQEITRLGNFGGDALGEPPVYIWSGA